MAFASLEADQKCLPAGRNSCNKNIRHRRNLREKRRPTGVVHILSTEVCDADLITRLINNCPPFSFLTRKFNCLFPPENNDREQSAGGTSSETDDEGLDDDLNVKKNTAMNEQILFLPLPTAHLRALAAQHASRADQDDDEDEDDEHEEDESCDKEDHRDEDSIPDPQDMRQENERLRDQLKFKDAYIKQLEARVFQLEIQHKHNNSHLHNNSPKKRNN